MVSVRQTYMLIRHIFQKEMKAFSFLFVAFGYGHQKLAQVMLGRDFTERFHSTAIAIDLQVYVAAEFLRP